MKTHQKLLRAIKKLTTQLEQASELKKQMREDEIRTAEIKDTFRGIQYGRD